MKINKSKIILENLRFYAFHGVGDLEQKVGGQYTLTVVLYTDFAGAATSDRITDTLDYSTLYGLIKEEMQKPSRLLEKVCCRIAARLFHEFASLDSIDIRLTKENPPVGSDGGSASVEMHAERE